MKQKLTAEQRKQRSRERTAQKRQQVEQTHLHCEMDFRQRGPHWGMFCREHGTWIRWMRQDELVALKLIPELPPRYYTRYETDQLFTHTQSRPVKDSW